MGKITEDIDSNKQSSPSKVIMVGDMLSGYIGYIQYIQDVSIYKPYVKKEKIILRRSNSTSSADLETAITKTGFGKFNITLLMLSFSASCAISFATGSMSYIIPVATVDLDLSPTERALLQSSCYTGLISSGIVWGFISDAFGRKKVLVIGFLIDAFMTILAGAFPILPLMSLFKFLSGSMISGPYSIFPAYLTEVYPLKGRELVFLSMGLYICIGHIIQAGLATWIIPAQVPREIPFRSWQLFQIACCLPSFISGIGCLFLVESPKFLADKGNHEGALKVCQTIYSFNTGNLSTTYPIKRLNHKIMKTERKSKFSVLIEGKEIFQTPFVQKALILYLLYIGGLGSYNIMRLWLPEMLTLVRSSTLDPKQGLCPLIQEGNIGRSNSTSADLHEEEVFSKMIMANSGSVVGLILFLLLVRCTGKKIMLISCTFGAAICSLLIQFINTQYVIIVSSIYMALFDISIMCSLCYVLEIFPTKVRATGFGFFLISGKMYVLAMNFLMANVIYNYCEYLFYGVSLSSFIMTGLIFLIPKN